MYKKVLLPTDGSDLARTALAHAKYMAALGHADVVILQVVDGGGGDNDAAELNVREISEEMKFEDIGAVECVVRRGDAARTIVDVAHEEHADLIVMATRGRSGLRRMVMGSVADSVARQADCPVLLVTPQG